MVNMSGKKNGTKEVVRRAAKEVKKERGMVVAKMMVNMNMSGKKNGVKAIKEDMEVAKKERRATKDNNQVMVNMNMSGKKNGVKAIKVDKEVAKKERRVTKNLNSLVVVIKVDMEVAKMERKVTKDILMMVIMNMDGHMAKVLIILDQVITLEIMSMTIMARVLTILDQVITLVIMKITGMIIRGQAIIMSGKTKMTLNQVIMRKEIIQTS